jgi:hypothetical protein
MQIRLMLRKGISDYNGKLVEYKYITVIVDIPNYSEIVKFIDKENPPEVIGGEWIIDN